MTDREVGRQRNRDEKGKIFNTEVLGFFQVDFCFLTRCAGQ